MPEIFYGDCSQAEKFVEQVKTYFRVNQGVAGFDSPHRKCAFMLSLVQGPDTQEWVRDMGYFLDQLQMPADNVPDLWTQFLTTFEQQFQDSYCEQTARAKLN